MNTLPTTDAKRLAETPIGALGIGILSCTHCQGDSDVVEPVLIMFCESDGGDSTVGDAGCNSPLLI